MKKSMEEALKAIAIRRKHDHVQQPTQAMEMESACRNVMLTDRKVSPEYQSTEYRPNLFVERRRRVRSRSRGLLRAP